MLVLHILFDFQSLRTNQRFKEELPSKATTHSPKDNRPFYARLFRPFRCIVRKKNHIDMSLELVQYHGGRKKINASGWNGSFTNLVTFNLRYAIPNHTWNKPTPDH
jgi:hypothetical protein